MKPTVHKVTCFIICPGDHERELLLIQHPYAGVQIPAGTAEPGEEPKAAALREALEESGLQELMLVRWLGDKAEPLAPGQLMVAYPTPVYSRPDPHSFAWANFRTGLTVEVFRQEADFTQVQYTETDRLTDPQYVTYNIIGWVEDAALTDQQIRHFYLFEVSGSTQQKWSVSTDNHIFTLFWSSIHRLPAIVPPQDGWMKYLVGI